MMEASDIARITYELMRQREDRIFMSWEDDRGGILREFTKLEKLHQKDVRTQERLKQDMASLKQTVYAIANIKENPSQLSKAKKSLSIEKSRHHEEVSVKADKSMGSAGDRLSRNYSMHSTSEPSRSTNKSSSSSSSSGSREGQGSSDENLVKLSVSARRSSSLVSSSTTCVPVKHSKDPTTTSSTSTVTTTAAPKPYVDTGGRKRSVRETMDGHECEECRRYFRVMEEQGLITSDAERKEILKKCSRHKSRWEAPATPEGYWDLTMQTPEDWSRTKKKPRAATTSSASALSSAIGHERRKEEEDDDCDG